MPEQHEERARRCECCDEPASYRGDLEGWFCDDCPHGRGCEREHEPDDPDSHACEGCGGRPACWRSPADGYACEACWPDAEPDPLAKLERDIARFHAIVRSISDADIAKMGELEQRLLRETRAHLAEYDRAKRGEGRGDPHASDRALVSDFRERHNDPDFDDEDDDG